MRKVDQNARPELRGLSGEELENVSGGNTKQKQLRAAIRHFDDVVADAVVTMDDLAALHQLK